MGELRPQNDRQFIHPRDKGALASLLYELMQESAGSPELTRESRLAMIREDLQSQAQTLLMLGENTDDKTLSTPLAERDCSSFDTEGMRTLLHEELPRLIHQYDRSVLGSYNEDDAVTLKNETCIPCFIRYPKGESRLIQLLYLAYSMSDDTDDMIAPQDVAADIDKLNEERMECLYNLRCNLLSDFVKAEERFQQLKNYPTAQEYYRWLLEQDPPHESEYHRLVALAETGQESNSRHDYMKEKSDAATAVLLKFYDAWNQFSVMEELVKLKQKNSAGNPS